MNTVPYNQIRADFDDTSMVVYQAYNPQIALAAVKAQRFVPPFSLNRMTWIKPSFLWMMERSNWAQKPGQEHVLAVRITRAGWEEALSLGVLTHPEPKLYKDPEEWRTLMSKATVNIQWDPERNLQGGSLEHRSIQVGLSRHIIERYVEEWTQSITDITSQVHKMKEMIRQGKTEQAKKLLPKERAYPVPEKIGRRIMFTE